MEYKTESETLEYHCDYDVALNLFALDDWDNQQERQHKAVAQEAAKAKAAAKEAAERATASQPHKEASKPVSGSASGADINQYAMTIRNAIASRLDTSAYIGTQCTVKIYLQQDGTLTGVDSEGGDAELCTQVMIAMNKIHSLPKPSSEAIYQLFKNAVINFKP